jgi:hypothetical protein
MARLQKLLVIALLFAFSACSPKPGIPIEASVTFTPYASGTETALAVSMAQTEMAQSAPENSTLALPTFEFPSYPTITSSPTPLVSLPPTTTPTAAVMPSGFSPVLLGKKYDADTFFTLLGGVQGGKWLTADQAAAQIGGASDYDVYILSKGMYQVYGYAPVKSQPYPDYYLSTDATLDETGMIGVVHGWSARQGNVEELDSADEIYRQVILDWLSQAGVADPQIGTMQIYRVDLEDDGTDEIFISATRVESQHTTAVGDHSIILMRKVNGNEAVTIPVLVDMYASVKPGNPFPCTYTIGNFIDLNQDGVLEVVAEYQRWEGFGAAVYQVNGQNVSEVLGSTCMTP